MGPAQVRPRIDRRIGRAISLAAVAAVAVLLVAGVRMVPTRGASIAQAPPPVAATSAPHQDVHLASLQEAFAISHLGAIRDESEVEAQETAHKAAQEPKSRVAVQKPVRPAAATPLPPAVPQATPAPAREKPAPEKTSLLSYAPKLPTPRQVVDKVASLGESLVSLVRGRQ